VKVFPSTESGHVEVVASSREGRLAQHPVGFVAGNFSMLARSSIVSLMGSPTT
jgi:hypothetical protein